MTSDESKMIQQEIQTFLSGSEPKLSEIRALVQRHSALPLLLDWGGFVGMKSSGELVVIAVDDSEEPRAIVDAETRQPIVGPSC